VRSKAKACEKLGISSETKQYPKDFSENELLGLIDGLNANEDVHGILVQLPLPKHIDEKKIIEAIHPDKDVDGFHPVNIGKLAAGNTDGFVPCTPAGIIELLIRSGNSPQGKHVVIVGRSNIVGKPVGLLCLLKGERGDATVTYCHSRTADLASITKQADILIAAVGRPEMIREDMVKPGVVIIDVGTNRVEDSSRPKGYRITGDVHFESVSKVASSISPVPGGVGPMTITMLLKNTIDACKKLKGLS
jgi:methylenetetrahydrofolate dehydrogenase (NADP+)/methenyltetrahydrofolate cyclohydrolase